MKNFSDVFRNFLIKVSKMSIETTLVKIVGKFLSKNSRKMEKNGKFDVTTTICENAKFLFCLTQL